MAREYVKKQCDCVLGEISVPCTEDYWIFPIHPEKLVTRVRRI